MPGATVLLLSTLYRMLPVWNHLKRRAKPNSRSLLLPSHLSASGQQFYRCLMQSRRMLVSHPYSRPCMLDPKFKRHGL